jgi:hypothetical protein
MSKFDLLTAYKQVPCRIEDLRLQGFMWLHKYFCETRQIFGGSISVCNFYTLLQDLTQDSAALTGWRRTKRSGEGKMIALYDPGISLLR